MRARIERGATCGAREARRGALGISLTLALLAAGGAAAWDGQAEVPPWMGVYLDDAVDGGVQIVALVPGGPAQAGGLEPGDVLVRVGELGVADLTDLEQVLRVHRPGDQLEIRVLRAGAPLLRKIALASKPARAWPLEGVVPRAPAPPEPPGPSALEIVDMTPELRAHFGAPVEAGVLVARVAPGTVAARSGIAAGDVVVRLDTRPVAVAERVREELLHPRSRVVTVVRDRRAIDIELAPVVVPDKESVRGKEAERRRQLEREIEWLERRVAELRRELERGDARADADD
jgi:S1-C subfamily serine protease